jgi:hypothetical protein
MIGNQIAQLSYELFHTIMASGVAGDKKCEAARPTMNGAYSWDKYLPWVEDPKDVLVFLEHHIELQANGETQDIPITNAPRALAYASGKETIEALEKIRLHSAVPRRGHLSVFQGPETVPASESHLVLHSVGRGPVVRPRG